MKTMHVLGLGPTLKCYTPDGNETIGVNDIWNYVTADYVVCVDRPRRFNGEDFRVNGMVNGKQNKFFSHIPEWSPVVNNFELIQLAPIRSDISYLDTDMICNSINSTFVAAVMAYKMGATKIIMHGVDFTGHHTLSKPSVLKRSINDFIKLHAALAERGVELRVSSSESELAKYIGLSQ